MDRFPGLHEVGTDKGLPPGRSFWGNDYLQLSVALSITISI